MNIDDLRAQIDDIDNNVQELISNRAKLAILIAQLKKTSDNPTNDDYYRPEREAKILTKAIERNEGPLSDQVIRHIFREIMSACLALENKTKVAYLGPVGTYTQSAVEKHFGSFIEAVPFLTISDVFREVELGDSPYGVVPVENSSQGVVNLTLDELINSSLKICGEIDLPIHHNLMSQCSSITQIKRVYAHQQSLLQCNRWLDINLVSALQIPVSSNAEAAKMAKNARDSAAIASKAAAFVYGHNILAKRIENEARNTTRFLVIGKQKVEPSGNDKTSLILTTNNKPGSLFSMLKPFSDNSISLTKIESRPSRKTNWDYLFFIDIIGHQQDPIIQKVLQQLDDNNQLISILGSYPKAI